MAKSGRPKKTQRGIASAKAYGEWIAAAIEKTGYSRVAIAAKAGVSTMTVHRVEKGLGASPDTLRALAKALDLDEAEACGRLGIPFVPVNIETSITQQKLLGFVQILSPRRQQELVGIAQMMTLSDGGRRWIITEIDNFQEAVTNIVKATEPHQ